MIKESQYNNLSLFSNSQKKIIILFCSSIILSFSILSIWGGLAVLSSAMFFMLISIPVVYYCEKLIRLDGLILGFVMAVTYKSIFLISRLVFLNAEPTNAIIIFDDASGYINSAFNPNTAELILTDYGTDIGYVYFLNYLVNIFNISNLQVPIVFVVPNIFVGSLIIVFAVMLSRIIIPLIHPSLVFWIATLDPILALYSTIVLKDILVSTLVSVSFVVFIIKKGHLTQIIGWIFATIGSFLLRWRSTGIIAIIVAFRILFSKNIAKRKKRQLITIVSIFIISIGLAGSNFNIIKLANRGKSIIDTELSHRIKIFTKAKMDSRSAGRLGQIINSLPSFPLRVAARTGMSLLAPVPPVQFYQFYWGDGIHDIKARIFRDLGGIFWYIMLPFLLIGTITMLRKKEYFIPLSLFVVLLIMGIGGWVDPRIRLMASLPTYILMAIGLTRYKFVKPYAIGFYSLLLFNWTIYELIF